MREIVIVLLIIVIYLLRYVRREQSARMDVLTVRNPMLIVVDLVQTSVRQAKAVLVQVIVFRGSVIRVSALLRNFLQVVVRVMGVVWVVLLLILIVVRVVLRQVREEEGLPVVSEMVFVLRVVQMQIVRRAMTVMQEISVRFIV